MAGAITFSGSVLASGLDTTSIVNALVSSAKIPMTQLQTEQSTVQSQSKKVTDIKTQLTALQTAAQALNSKSDALANKATATNSSVLTATASGGTAVGSYTVNVSQLAKAERTYSNSFSDAQTDGVAGAGTLSIQVGSGDPISIDVDATDSLADIASKINKAGAGVSAGVFSDGTNYRLQVTGSKTGAANAITFSESDGLSLGLTDPANEKQPAQDALLTVDGLAVKSSTNVVTGAVPGVSLALSTVGTSDVNVDADTTGLQAKLQTFVDSYNKVMNTLNAEFTVTAGVTKDADTLSGDSTMRTLQTQLRSMASTVLSNGSSNLQTFGSIGLVTQKDGTLSLDATKFQSAVTSDYEGVASLLAGKTDGTGLMSVFDKGVDQYTKISGTLDAKIANYSDLSKNYDKQIADMQTRIDKYTDQLNDQFTALETTMSNLKSQGNALTSMLSGSSSSSS